MLSICVYVIMGNKVFNYLLTYLRKDYFGLVSDIYVHIAYNVGVLRVHLREKNKIVF